MGSPTCWVHSKKEFHVKVGPSEIDGAGKGLIAQSTILSGTWICPYGGEPINQACLDLRFPGDVTATYAARRDGGRGYVDAACVRGLGSMANGLFNANGRAKSRAQHNAKILDRSSYGGEGEGLWIRSTKNIQNGREVFVHYGFDYQLEDGLDVTKRTRRADDRPC